MTHHELIIIGAGPGGYVAAIKAAQLGIEVLLIEQAETGGTCLNRGCIPTKTLLHTADLFAELGQAESWGIEVGGASINYDTLQARKTAICDQLRSGVEGLLEANGVAYLRGTATISDPKSNTGQRVEESLLSCDEHQALDQLSTTVHHTDGTSEKIFANNIIVATGSSPALPPIEGLNTLGVFTSDTMLASIPELGRLAIIGGGVIGMEFAGIYASFGAHVTVLEAAGRILPTMDREFGQSLSLSLKKRGCTVVAGAFVESIARQTDGTLIIHYTAKGESHTIEADGVLVSTGRVPNTKTLFGEGFTPSMERGRIAVDARMQTSVAHLYAIGDAADAGVQLAHAASAQGIVAACAIANKPCSINRSLVPSCIYTSPEIASVGVTEAEAKEEGITVRIGKFAMAGNAKTIITGQDRSFAKIIVNSDDVIIGAQLMCGRATDLIGELALAISAGLTIEQAASPIRAHPTFEEAIGEALEALLDGAIHALPRRKSK